MIPLRETLYFGCKGQAGHYVWDRHGQRPHNYQSLCYLDGLLPPAGEQVQGQARLYHFNGCTVVAFWDRSVDSRPGSNSFFAIPGKVSFQDAIERVKRDFPWVWDRLTFEVELLVD